jgi:hypothetical protein
VRVCMPRFYQTEALTTEKSMAERVKYLRL